MGNTYRIHVFDAADSARIAILTGATGIRFTREIRGTGEIRFELHRDDEQLSEVRLGRFVRVFDVRNETYPASGIVSGALDYGVGSGRGMVRVRAYGALTLLAFLRFPPNYMLQGTLAANKERLVQRYDWRRITAEDTAASGALGDEVLSFDGGGSGNQLGSFNQTESMDLGDGYEDGGAVVLAKSSGFYYASGTYVTPFIDFQSAPTTFDRLRYYYKQELETVRYVINTFANLSDTRIIVGTLQSDAAARGVGVDITGLTSRRYACVLFDLNTPRNDRTPMLEAVEVIARRAVPGITAAATLPSVELGVLSVGGLTLLRVLERICDLFGLEYRLTTGGVLEIQGQPSVGSVGAVWGTDRRNTYTFAEGKNANLVRYAQDDSELANYVVAFGTGQGDNQLACVVQDATSQAAYGVRQAYARFNSPTFSELKSKADTFLAERKNPLGSVELEILETPDGTASFEPGDLVRVVSRFRKNHSGGDLDETLRIVRETREETDGGERILLVCESKPRLLTSELGEGISGAWEEARAGLKLHETGKDWSPVLTDSSEHTYTVALPFTPYAADATVLEVEHDPNGTPSFHTPHDGNAEIQVTAVGLGTNKMTYTVKRVSGSLDYRALVRWEAWGAEFGGLRRE